MAPKEGHNQSEIKVVIEHLLELDGTFEALEKQCGRFQFRAKVLWKLVQVLYNHQIFNEGR